jgi:hypothetical protein
MLLYLINPDNPLVSLGKSKLSLWNRYTVWKPLGLLVIAGLTPKEWEIKIFDENVKKPDYTALPVPDLVGITSFTSQADRAYIVADEFKLRGVPVVMGGIHATMCPDEAAGGHRGHGRGGKRLERSARRLSAGRLKRVYSGTHNPQHGAHSPSRSYFFGIPFRLDSNHARLSAFMQFLQCFRV